VANHRANPSIVDGVIRFRIKEWELWLAAYLK
jgi:hypothetical protein